MIRVTTFRWVPPFAQGLVRDLRVRWAPRAGLPYEEHLISPRTGQRGSARCADGAVLEGERPCSSPARSFFMSPSAAGADADDGHAREQVRRWTLAALNSVSRRHDAGRHRQPAAGRARGDAISRRPSSAVSTSASTASRAFSAIANTLSTAGSLPPTS
jgi:hypothetical protein